MNVSQALLAALGAGPAGGGLSAGAMDGASPETALAFAGALANLGATTPGGLTGGLSAGQAIPAQQSPTRLPDTNTGAATLTDPQQLGTPATVAAHAPARVPRNTTPAAAQPGEQPSAAELLAASLLSLLPAEVSLGGPQAAKAPEAATPATAAPAADAAMLAAGMQSAAQLVAAQPVVNPGDTPALTTAQPAAIAAAAGQSTVTPSGTGVPAQRNSSPAMPARATDPAATGAAPAPLAGMAFAAAPAATAPDTHTNSPQIASTKSVVALAPTPASADTAAQQAGAAGGQGIPLPAGMIPAIPPQTDTQRPSRRTDLKVGEVGPTGPTSAPQSVVPGSASVASPIPGNEVQPAAPVHQPPNVAPQVSAQLAGHIGRIQSLGDGTHRMIIRIDPEALGPVRVVAEIRSGSLQVHLHATTQAGQAALAASLAEVRTDLTRIAPTASLDLGQGQFSQSQGGQNPQQSTDLTFGADLGGGRGGGHPEGRGTPDGQDVVPTHADPRSPARGTRAVQGAADDHAVDVTA